MNTRSQATSVVEKPPGKKIRSQRSMSFIGVVCAKVSPPSETTSPPSLEATMVSAPGMRLNTVCGAVKSSWVMPWKITSTMRNWVLATADLLWLTPVSCPA